MSKPRLPRINFRPVLFAALGCLCGVYLYLRIAFGGFVLSDALFFAAFLCLALVRGKKECLAAALIFLCFAGAGAGLAHWEKLRSQNAAADGVYVVAGTVQSVSVRYGETQAVLVSLTLDGEEAAGKMQVTLPSETVRPADILSFAALVERSPLPVRGDAAAQSAYANGVRYTATAEAFRVTGRAGDIFLRLNGDLYDALYQTLPPDEAGVAYALLVGNSKGMDASFLEESRTGGIAHAFAVSGLHIGILYGVAMLLFRPLRRFAFLPAIALAGCYSALCAFTVSSVRALLMCAVLGLCRMTGKKYDFLSSISFAGVVTMLFAPAEVLTASFRLSCGAVLGLALFAGTFSRGLRRIRLPAFLADYLAASAAVQLFTFPVMAETFGYVSVWGTLLNFIVIPALPVLFLPLVVCGIASALFPAAAGVLLALPEGMLAALLFVFAAADFSAVLAGFSLGAGGAVWLTAAALCSDRVRMRAAVRAAAVGVACALFALCLVWENVVFSGVKIEVYEHGKGMCALVRTPSACVLVIDDDVSLSVCEDVLMRRFGGELDAVAVVGEDAARGVNTAVFLPARAVYVRESAPWGLEAGLVRGGVRFLVEDLAFRYEGDALVLSAEGVLVKFDFSDARTFGADLYIKAGDGGLQYRAEHGIIKRI